MTVNVRLYTHAGLAIAPVSSSTRYTTDSISMLRQPYLGGEVLSPSTGTAATSLGATAPNGTSIAYVQVDPGARVYYEITPEGQTPRTATSSSPVLEGNTQFSFGPGWRFSCLEVA